MSDQISGGLRNMRLDHTQPELGSLESAIPRLRIPPSNIPPSDQDIEATLESARPAVLNSNDPDMQLAWAQDALHQIDINSEDCTRLQSMQIQVQPQSHTEYQIRMDAMNIVTFLADQHHPKAEFIKGTWYEFGKFGCRLDKKEAFRCYCRSADKKYARAEYRVGMLYEASNDPVKALQHYHRGVAMDDAACLYRVGMMTLRGQHGQVQDFAHGIELIRRSAQVADENAAQGAYVYGMLLAGELEQVALPPGTLRLDEGAARIEIEKAAYLKFAKAQLKLGAAYELGELGCDFSPAYSLHYYALAARQGESEAELGISKWFLVGVDGLFAKNDEVAYVYAQRAALSGLANAEFALGYFNELGIHVPKNIDLALEWYRKAAASGSVDAPGRIQGIAQKQVLNRSDHENIALHRIKTQHGSRRGARPARLAANKLPPVGELQPVKQRVGDSSLPPRVSSALPYPTDDRSSYVPAPRASSDTGAAPMRPTQAGMNSTPGYASGSSHRLQVGQTGAGRQSPMPRPIGSVDPDPHSYGQRMTPSPRIGYSPNSGPPRASNLAESRVPGHFGDSGQFGDSRPLASYPGRTEQIRPAVNAEQPKMRASSQPSTTQPSTSGAPTRRTDPLANPTFNAPPKTAPPVKPTKGPQTFEEMGVPAQKKGSDCVSHMLSSSNSS